MNYPHVTLKAVMAFAWDVEPDQITGPQWLDDERYDIAATLPSGGTQPQIPLMLQHMLIERFRMTLYEEAKPRPSLALVVGKDGPKLTRSTEKSQPGFEENNGKVTFMKLTLREFARIMTFYGGRHVADETHVEGEYDITVNATTAELKQGSFPSAIQDLGLKLETRNLPARFLVVDKADKTPTEN